MLEGWNVREDGTGLDLWEGGVVVDSRQFDADEIAAITAAKEAEAAAPAPDPLHAVVHAIAAIAATDPTIAALPEVADVVTIAEETTQ